MKNRLTKNVIDAINHDLKSPIATIKLSADILQNHSKKLSPDVLQKNLEKINSKVDYLTQTINNLTDLFKIDNDFSVYNDYQININQLVSNITGSFNSLKVVCRIDKQLKVKLDQDCLERVIESLIHFVNKNFPPHSPLYLSLKQNKPNILFSFFALKDKKFKKQILDSDFKPQIDTDWHQIKDFHIATAFASEFFQHYRGQFNYFYNSQIGAIFQANLPIL